MSSRAQEALQQLNALECGQPATQQATDGDPIVAFRDAVAALQAQGMSKRAAVRKVCLTNPDLHRQYVEASQPQ